MMLVEAGELLRRLLESQQRLEARLHHITLTNQKLGQLEAIPQLLFSLTF
jgi:hypothetical protein